MTIIASFTIAPGGQPPALPLPFPPPAGLVLAGQGGPVVLVCTAGASRVRVRLFALIASVELAAGATFGVGDGSSPIYPPGAVTGISYPEGLLIERAPAGVRFTGIAPIDGILYREVPRPVPTPPLGWVTSIATVFVAIELGSGSFDFEVRTS